MFNRAICNLASKGVTLTTADFSKYKLIHTLSNFIEKNQAELFMVKLKMTMMSLNGKKAVQEKPIDKELTTMSEWAHPDGQSNNLN